MRFSASLFGLLLAFASPSFAQEAIGPDDYMPDVTAEDPLTEEELYTVFSGQTHRGTYTFLSRDITTFAFEEETAADGSVVHIQQQRVDTGSWAVTGNIICYDYDDPELLQACFNIYARGNCYYHFQVSVTGRPQTGFTARSVIKGEVPNCEPSLV